MDDRMKKKIIAIVISVVIVTGAGTGIGVFVKQSNDKNTQELINAAVSQALATTESTATAESTTEEATTEESTTRKHLGAPQPKTTTENTTKSTTTTTTTPDAIYHGTGTKTTTEYIQPSLEDRHCKQYKRALINGEKTMVCIIEGNCPDAGRYCYWDKNDNLIYIDDLSQIDFIDE